LSGWDAEEFPLPWGGEGRDDGFLPAIEADTAASCQLAVEGGWVQSTWSSGLAIDAGRHEQSTAMGWPPARQSRSAC
jgi:hypothetical protein